MRLLLMIALCLGSGSALCQSYYQLPGADPESAVRKPAARQKEEAGPTNVRRMVVTDDSGRSEGGPGRTSVGGGDSGDRLESRTDGQVALPRNMERGVRDLESGLEDVGQYTGEMAAHLQKNGLRGYLAVPPELKEKGRAIGRKVGGGINGIMQDVSREMVSPQHE